MILSSSQMRRKAATICALADGADVAQHLGANDLESARRDGCQQPICYGTGLCDRCDRTSALRERRASSAPGRPSAPKILICCIHSM